MDKKLKIRLAVAGIGAVALFLLAFEIYRGFAGLMVALALITLTAGKYFEEGTLTREWKVYLLTVPPGIILLGFGYGQLAIPPLVVGTVALFIGGVEWKGKTIYEMLRGKNA